MKSAPARRAKAVARRKSTPARRRSAPVRTGTLLPASEASMMSQLDQWFERSFGHLISPTLGLPGSLLEGLRAPLDVRMPRVDVLDRDADVLVRAELPGVDKKDVQVSSTGRTLTIRADAGNERERREGRFYRREISHRSYQRTVALPSGVDPERARASLAHGVLEISIPKVETRAKKPLDLR